MWVKFRQETDTNNKGDIIWIDNDYEGEILIEEKIASRVLGPDGLSLEEAAPEDILDKLGKEDINWQERKLIFEIE